MKIISSWLRLIIIIIIIIDGVNLNMHFYERHICLTIKILSNIVLVRQREFYLVTHWNVVIKLQNTRSKFYYVYVERIITCNHDSRLIADFERWIFWSKKAIKKFYWFFFVVYSSYFWRWWPYRSYRISIGSFYSRLSLRSGKCHELIKENYRFKNFFLFVHCRRRQWKLNDYLLK